MVFVQRLVHKHNCQKLSDDDDDDDDEIFVLSLAITGNTSLLIADDDNMNVSGWKTRHVSDKLLNHESYTVASHGWLTQS